MSVFLIGGGWSDDHVQDVYGGFLHECASRASGPPRIRLVVMGVDPEAMEYHERFVRALALAGSHELVVTRVREGDSCPDDILAGADGLLVGGGVTPDYHAALSGLYPQIREQVSAGLPYAGFSAGAAIAATTAVIGGWTIDGVAVCQEDASEDLGPVTVVQGMGLVEGGVDAHAAQWGTLSRMVGAVDAQLVKGGVAIDENTCLVMDGPHRRITGAGVVWQVWPAAEGVGVSVLRPAKPDQPGALS
ncbi:MAG TPA: Type 1 glutamine amidotransferase-like domain-containing protein [Nocardioidaceae bacterium]|nr:Type 1 glutamine amidotransferase-like domain-containing protein [Nocardioidaceae bacterium]